MGVKKTAILMLLGGMLLFGGTALALGAEPVTLSSLDDVAALALENNLDLKASLWSLQKTRDNLPSIWGWDSSSVTLTGETGKTEGGEASEDLWEGPWGSVSLSIPVVDQFRLEGTVNDDATGRIGGSFFPLVHSDEVEQGRITLSSGELEVAQDTVEAENRALIAALNWMNASAELDIQVRFTELREAEYRDSRIRYEAGEATLDEVRTALQEWSAAQSLTGTARDLLRSSETELAAALGVEDFVLEPFGVETVREGLADLQKEFSSEADVSAHYAVLQDALSIESLEETLKATWLFDPSLQADIFLNWDESGSWSVEAGVSLSFSLEDFQGEIREELAGDLALKREQADREEKSAELALAQALESLEITRLNREVAELSREEAGLVAVEAAFLYDRGELSPIEWEEAVLEEKSAEATLFKALADEYAARLQLRFYL